MMLAVLSASVPSSAALMFEPPVHYAAGLRATGLAAGDFDGNGLADLAVVSSRDDKTMVLYGQPDGGMLIMPTLYIFRGNQIAAADFNGDHVDDLAVAPASNSRLVVAYGKEGVGIDRVEDLATTFSMLSVATGDTNGDGYADIVAGAGAGSSSSSGRLVVVYGRGDGSFLPPVEYSTVGGTFAVAVGDLNHDEFDDVVDVSRWVSHVRVRLSGAGGVPSTQTMTYTRESRTPYRAEIADFNADGRSDFAVLCYADANVSMYLAAEAGGFTHVGTEVWGIGHPTQRDDLLGRDFDRDGRMELVLADPFAQCINFYTVRPDGTLGPPHSIPIGAVGSELEAADLNGDGWLDLAVGHESDGNVTIIYNALPEPATASLLVLSGLMLVGKRR